VASVGWVYGADRSAADTLEMTGGFTRTLTSRLPYGMA